MLRLYTVLNMNKLAPTCHTRMTRRGALILTTITSILLTASLVTSAGAHGNTLSNLDAQILEVAPETAEFLYSSDIDRASAKASLRYLGEESLDAEDYFAFNVPTINLEQVEPLDGVGPEFAFRLPKLGKGAYAIDWEVTPVTDHADTSTTFFEITVGVSDADPIPALAEMVIADDSGAPLGVMLSNEDTTSDNNKMLAFLGALILVAILTAFYTLHKRND